MSDNEIPIAFARLKSVGELPTENDPNICKILYYNGNELSLLDVQGATGFGSSVANSMPTSTAGAGLNFGANWSMDTQGYKYFVKGLSDKSNNENFNRILVQGENGETAFSNGTNQIINAMQNATDLQKEAWRMASKKEGENYSLGSPFVTSILPPLQKKENGVIKFFILKGNSLYLNENFTKITAIPVGVIENDVTNANEIECVSFFSPTNGEFLRVGFNSDDILEGVEYNIIIRTDSPNLYKFRTNDKFKLQATIQSIDLTANWIETTKTGVDSPMISGTAGAFNMGLNGSESTDSDSGIISSLKKVLPTNGGNFYIKMSFNFEICQNGSDKLSLGFGTQSNDTAIGNLLNTNLWNIYSYSGEFQNWGGLGIQSSQREFYGGNGSVRNGIIVLNYESGTLFISVECDGFSNKYEEYMTVDIENLAIQIFREKGSLDKKLSGNILEAFTY